MEIYLNKMLVVSYYIYLLKYNKKNWNWNIIYKYTILFCINYLHGIKYYIFQMTNYCTKWLIKHSHSFFVKMGLFKI